MLLLLLCAAILALAVYRAVGFFSTPNPFVNDTRRRRGPYIGGQKERDAVLKQGFSQVHNIQIKEQKIRHLLVAKIVPNMIRFITISYM